MKTLEEIATYYGTAKVPHGYMPIYDNYFTPLRDKKITLLEIGVAQGDSLRTWSEYFSNGMIIGIDKSEPIRVDHCQVMQGDAIDTVYANRIAATYGYFDIIIDDGSHYAHEQIATFNNYFPHLAKGGWYVIEDLFALYDKDWNDQENETIIDVIQKRMKSILIGGDDIQEVHYFGRNDINGILFLRKRYEPFRIQPLSEFKMK